MSGKGDSRNGQRRLDAAAKTQFIAALRRGERREDADHAAGFSLMGFYGARRRDPAFRADWTEALATSAAAERRALAYAERGIARQPVASFHPTHIPVCLIASAAPIPAATARFSDLVPSI